MKFFTKENIVSFFLVTLILTPIALIKLGSFPMRLWDESMFSVNSYEMLQRNEFIIPYFDGKMNLWNSKPPLSLWLQMASIKLVGFNELAVRLPSAIAAMGCVLLLFFFLKKHIDPLFAWLTILILITSQGFFSVHTGRTADTDAVLTFILTAANLLFMDTIIRNKISNKRLLLFFILITLGFLCKSFAALLFSTGYLIILLIRKNHFTKSPFLKPGFWFGILIFAISALSYLVIRNTRQPGYIDYLFSIDIGRLATVIEEHKEPFTYYIEDLSTHSFRFWFFFSVSGLLILFKKDLNKTLHSILLLSSILLISYFLIISLSVTKLPWYTMPVYPLLVILASTPIYLLLQLINLKTYAQITAIIVLFIYPYSYVFGLSQSNPCTPFENINESGERYVFNETEQNKFIDSSYVLHSGFPAGMKFYQHKLKEQQLTLFITEEVKFPSGALVIVSRDSLKEKLKNKYHCILVDSTNHTCKYRIAEK